MVDYIFSAFFLILALWGVVEGILTLIGKQDNYISCLNKPGSELYNVKRVRLVKALQEFVWAIWFVVLAFKDENIKVAWIMTCSVFLLLLSCLFLKELG